MGNFFRDLYCFFTGARKLHVSFDVGNKKKPTLIMIHGIAATSLTWKNMIELLQDDYRLIGIDLLGFGGSPSPSNCKYNVNDHVASLRRTIKGLKLKKSYSIIGHSMGSIIALRYTVAYQREIKHLYLTSMPIYQKKFDEGLNLVDKKIDVYQKIYDSLISNKKFTLSTASKLRDLFGGEGNFDVREDNWHSFRESLVNTVLRHNSFSDINKVKVPIDVIYGNIDPLLVQANLNKLGEYPNVRIHKLPMVTHLVDNRFAKAVTDIIKN